VEPRSSSDISEKRDISYLCRESNNDVLVVQHVLLFAVQTVLSWLPDLVMLQ
jgi:hypothetical protein